MVEVSGLVLVDNGKKILHSASRKIEGENFNDREIFKQKVEKV